MANAKDQDLASTLSPGQRRDLSVLIASITQKMREQTVSRFEGNSKKFTKEDPVTAVEESDKREAGGLETASSGQKESNEASKQDQSNLSPEEEDLKAAVLAFFDDWQGKVLHCVNDALRADGGKQFDIPRQEKASGTLEAPAEEPLPSTQTTISLAAHYPPISNPLSRLPNPERISILHLTLLLLLSLTVYPAHSRILLLYLSTSLSLPATALSDLELATAHTLLSSRPPDEPTQPAPSSAKWKIGLATLSGAALIGITGGLATPLVAAGVGGLFTTLGLGGTVAAGYLSALAGSGVVVGSLFGAYGGRVTGKIAQEYTREVEDFAILPLRRRDLESENPEDASSGDNAQKSEPAEEDKRLTVTICVSGLLHSSPRDLFRPWSALLPTNPPPPTSLHTLRFDPPALLFLTSTLTSFPTSYATTLIQSEVLKRTALAPLLAATWPLSFLKFGKILDNPFSLARVRADKAGVLLADALARRRVLGDRPVRLVGFSMGARVVLACLRELGRRGEVGVVEDVIVMGAPMGRGERVWRVVRAVVQGRVVNVFSRRDWVLGVLERVGSLDRVAGVEEVVGIEGVENVDASDLVMGHGGWLGVVGRVLERCGWGGLDGNAIREEKMKGEKTEREEKAREADKADAGDQGEEGEGLQEVDTWLEQHSEPAPDKQATQSDAPVIS